MPTQIVRERNVIKDVLRIILSKIFSGEHIEEILQLMNIFYISDHIAPCIIFTVA